MRELDLEFEFRVCNGTHTDGLHNAEEGDVSPQDHKFQVVIKRICVLHRTVQSPRHCFRSKQSSASTYSPYCGSFDSRSARDVAGASPLRASFSHNMNRGNTTS